MSDIAQRKRQLAEVFIKASHAHQVELHLRGGQGDPLAFAKATLGGADPQIARGRRLALLSTGPDAIKQWIDTGKCLDDSIRESLGYFDALSVRLADDLPVTLVTDYLGSKTPDAPLGDLRSIAALVQVLLEIGRDTGDLQAMFKLLAAAGMPVFLEEVGLHLGDEAFRAMAAEIAPATCACPYTVTAEDWFMALHKLHRWGEKFSGKITVDTYARDLLALPEIQALAPAIKGMPPRTIGVLGHSFTLSMHWASHASMTGIASRVLHEMNPGIVTHHIAAGSLLASRALKEFFPRLLDLHSDIALLVLLVHSDNDLNDLCEMIRRLRATGSRVCIFDALNAGFGAAKSSYGPEVGLAAATAGAEVISVRELLGSHPMQDRFVSVDGVHMTPVYHKVMAVELVRRIASPGSDT